MDAPMYSPPRFRLPIWVVLPLLLLTLVVGVAGGRWYARAYDGVCPEGEQVCQDFSKFWTAWQVAEDNFVDPNAIDPQKMTDGAITGMLDSLGDEGHTRYLPAEAAKAERESLSGRFEGIGAYITERDGQVLLQPIDGSPAELAGLRTGDVLLRVNGETIEGMSTAEIAAKVRGPKDTSVTLTVLHEAADLPVDITVTRDEITTPSTLWQMLPNKVAMVRLTQFSEPSAEDMRKALTELQQQGAQAVILDLRNNPGGLVVELVEIAGMFLPKGSTVLLEQDRSGDKTPYTTDTDPVLANLPVVVLVNNYSASSAEILAGSLQENGRAKVLGTPTFGTATVLRSFDLGGGAEMRLGTTQWLTPKGEVVRGKGITPDEIVSLPPQAAPLSPREASQLSEQALLEGEDTQLARALQVIQTTLAGR
ncbi:MAG: S41 family peptidase [Roseiflexaceae bacterium]